MNWFASVPLLQSARCGKRYGGLPSSRVHHVVTIIAMLGELGADDGNRSPANLGRAMQVTSNAVSERRARVLGSRFVQTESQLFLFVRSGVCLPNLSLGAAQIRCWRIDLQRG